jgi:beta-lactamase regulating signal transducer with metallopeptidase domain
MSMSLSACLIILAVIVVRAFFIHELPKKTFTALWGIAVYRLLIPFSVKSDLCIWNIADILRARLQTTSAVAAPPPPEIPMGDVISDLAQTLSTTPAISNPSPAAINIAGVISAIGSTSLPWYFWLWLAGSCTCALYFLITHLRCLDTYKTALPVENSFINQWLGAHPLRRKVLIRQSDKIDAPLTYGIIRPVILFPSSTDWHDETCLLCIMAHEHAHIRRFDVLLKWLLAAALSLHWFNPLAWLMYAFANRDIELACDEKVVREYGEKAKSVYALTLISMGEKRRRLTSFCGNFSKGAIEERMIALMVTTKITITRVLLALILVSSVAILFATAKAESKVPGPVPPDFEVGTIFTSLSDASLTKRYEDNIWKNYELELETAEWNWYSEKEYLVLMEDANAEYRFSNYASDKIYPAALMMLDKEPAKLMQTLADIRNGIKVSRPKHIHLVDRGEPTADMLNEWIMWYCFSYVVKDKDGSEVDLGLFETRDDLFAALKEHYQQEVEKGSLTQAEADRLYKQIAHQTRNNDEMHLQDKLQIARSYSFIAQRNI